MEASFLNGCSLYHMIHVGCAWEFVQMSNMPEVDDEPFIKELGDIKKQIAFLEQENRHTKTALSRLSSENQQLKGALDQINDFISISTQFQSRIFTGKTFNERQWLVGFVNESKSYLNRFFDPTGSPSLVIEGIENTNGTRCFFIARYTLAFEFDPDKASRFNPKGHVNHVYIDQHEIPITQYTEIDTIDFVKRLNYSNYPKRVFKTSIENVRKIIASIKDDALTVKNAKNDSSLGILYQFWRSNSKGLIQATVSSLDAGMNITEWCDKKLQCGELSLGFTLNKPGCATFRPLG